MHNHFMIIYVYRGTEIASPRPRQGQAKAAPRPRQDRGKAAPRPRQGATRKKRTSDAPKGSPQSSYWSYWAPCLSIFETVLFNL